MKEKLVIFLDRDGVINKKRSDYVKNTNELEFITNIFKGIKQFNDLGFTIIIITNQSVINRKIISEEQLKKIHNYMLKIMKKNACNITKIYYCPHRPNEKCNCRKPNTGMIEKAIKDFKIEISNSILIGDSKSDIEAATKMGIKSIKIETDGQLMDLIEDIKKIFSRQLNKKCEK